MRCDDTLEIHTLPLTLWKKAGKPDEHQRSNPHTRTAQLKMMKKAMVGGWPARGYT